MVKWETKKILQKEHPPMHRSVVVVVVLLQVKWMWMMLLMILPGMQERLRLDLREFLILIQVVKFQRGL